MDKVAAIILNYNSSDDSRKCVNYLFEQDYPELSIIVVDNASSLNDEKQKLKKWVADYSVNLIESDRNRGFSAGNNLGLRYAVNGGGWTGA